MKPVTVATRGATVFALVASLALGCGGQTGDDPASQISPAGTGGRNSGTGGAVGVGGSTSEADAGTARVAGICDANAALFAVCGSSKCCGTCGTNSVSTADLVACTVPLQSSPPDPSRVAVVFNCVLVPPLSPFDFDAGIATNDDGWAIDYRFEAAHLVLGASLCEKVQLMGVVPLDVFTLCGGIC